MHIIAYLWYNITIYIYFQIGRLGMGTFKITTDDTLMEMIQHGSGSYPFAYYLEDIWQFDFHRIDWHWHHELEFMVVTEGAAICLDVTTAATVRVFELLPVICR